MKYKLVCFDLDGTLADGVEFSWQLLHDFFETPAEARAEAKDKYFAKEISYEDWAKHDIELWKKHGATKQAIQLALKNLTLMHGAMDVLVELKNKGYKLALISGSLNVFLEYVLPTYKQFFDYVFLNKIFFNEDGEIIDEEITNYDIENKADALKLISKKENIPLSQCVFIGDHYNDLGIIQEAGLGIAFNCKSEELAKVADIVIEKKDLREVLKYVK